MRADIKAMKEVLVTKWSAFRGRPDFIMPLRGPRLKAMAKALVFNSCAPLYPLPLPSPPNVAIFIIPACSFVPCQRCQLQR